MDANGPAHRSTDKSIFCFISSAGPQQVTECTLEWKTKCETKWITFFFFIINSFLRNMVTWTQRAIIIKPWITTTYGQDSCGRYKHNLGQQVEERHRRRKDEKKRSNYSKACTSVCESSRWALDIEIDSRNRWYERTKRRNRFLLQFILSFDLVLVVYPIHFSCSLVSIHTKL